MGNSPRRSVFFISDGTGITVETLGQSLIAHFPGVHFRQTRFPFIDSLQKAQACLPAIEQAAREDGVRPVLFSTLVNDEVRAVFEQMDVMIMDHFDTFILPLAHELNIEPVQEIGQGWRADDNRAYQQRIAAVNYALDHDDGSSEQHLSEADIILVGVSRSGKTPTSLYLAMQFGVKAANYPLIPEDFERGRLPEALNMFRNKLFGLSIRPDRLHEIRNERRPNSRYSSLDNCRSEVKFAETMMFREGIEWMDSTSRSIEELAALLMQVITKRKSKAQV